MNKLYFKSILVVLSVFGMVIGVPMQAMQRLGRVVKRIAPKVIARTVSVAANKAQAYKPVAAPVKVAQRDHGIKLAQAAPIVVQSKQVVVAKPTVVVGGTIDKFKRYLQATKPAQQVQPMVQPKAVTRVEAKAQAEVKAPAVKSTAPVQKSASQVRILSPFEQLYAMGYNPIVTKAAPKTIKQDNQLIKYQQPVFSMCKRMPTVMPRIVVPAAQVPAIRVAPALPALRNYSVAPRVIMPVSNQIMLLPAAERALVPYRGASKAVVAVSKPSYSGGGQQQENRKNPFNPMPFLIGSGVVGSVVLYNYLQDNQVVLGQAGKKIKMALQLFSDGCDQLMQTLKQRKQQSMASASKYMRDMVQDLRKFGLVGFLIDKTLFRNLPKLPAGGAHVLVQNNEQVAVAGQANNADMVPVIMSEDQARALLGDAYDAQALHMLVAGENNPFGNDVAVQPLRGLPSVKHAAIKFQQLVASHARIDAPAGAAALEAPEQEQMPDVANAQEAMQQAACDRIAKALNSNSAINIYGALIGANLRRMLEAYNSQLALYEQYPGDAYVVGALGSIKQTITDYLHLFNSVMP